MMSNLLISVILMLTPMLCTSLICKERYRFYVASQGVVLSRTALTFSCNTGSCQMLELWHCFKNHDELVRNDLNDSKLTALKVDCLLEADSDQSNMITDLHSAVKSFLGN